MSAAASGVAPVLAQHVSKTFKRKTGETVAALVDVSLEARAGTLTTLVGPDGAGKSTFLRLAAGLVSLDQGRLEVLGFDVRTDASKVQARIGYMPQKFGLYEDLSVQENLDLYADIHGVGVEQRQRIYSQLMSMTALQPFMGRLAGRLSGGMKQKLGLACTLVRSPRLLLLDEPTVGVDPLSRRELWAILMRLVKLHGLTVLLSTSYLDEVERCDQAVVMHAGKVIAIGPPAEIAARAARRAFVAEPTPGQSARALQSQLLGRPGIVDALPSAGRVRFITAHPFEEIPSAAPRFEDGFMALLHDREHRRPMAEGGMTPERSVEAPAGRLASPDSVRDNGLAVEVRDLVRKFGRFTAVDHLTFEVRAGEVFGLLGANGAGKTTTFRMLCGLLPATSGTLRVAGADLRESRAAARERLGYMAQKFSLYGMLTVAENLDFFARTYGLDRRRKKERIGWAVQEFDLERFLKLPATQLPGGFKQRLALAAALLHEPEMLFLDEPTSGADPIARREFWVRINLLAEQGVTVIVTTHFMEEAEYCDRVLILESGRVLAEGTPAEIRARGQPTSGREVIMEDAFVSIVQAGRRRADAAAVGGSS